MLSYTLAQLAEHLGADLHGDGALSISAVASLEQAAPAQLTFLSNTKYRRFLEQTLATAVLLKAEDLPFCAVAALVVKDPYVAFAKVAQLLDNTPDIACDIHPTAVIDPTAQVASDACLGPYVVIGKHAVVGARAQIGAGCYIGEGAVVGADCKIWPQVTLYHRVVVGERCIIHSGAVLGADGFGFANERGKWLKIPQTGSVRIGADCEIGANTTIDRGALGDTVIGNNVILDNLVQIAHNVHIGDHSCLAGCTVVAGSTKIGKYCVFGGACAINGHIEICDAVQITGMTMITKSITEKGIYSSGMPAASNLEWRKNTARYRQMEQMYQRLRDVELQLAQLRAETGE